VKLNRDSRFGGWKSRKIEIIPAVTGQKESFRRMPDRAPPALERRATTGRMTHHVERVGTWQTYIEA
jgi:hypothetical protein